MKKVLTLIVLASCCSLVIAQEGTQIGFQVSTGARINTHHSKTTTLWSFQTGYGFSLGVPVRHWTGETSALLTGLEYEYAAFDNRFNNTLVSSTRYHSISIPLALDYQVASNWFASFGSGFRYFVASRTFASGNSVDISGSANPFQPYVSLGISTLSARDAGLFELGALIRYHFLDLWKKSYPDYAVTSSKILSFDLVMRFYF